MYPLTYHRPKTLAEAKEMFGAGADATFLSGGHTLLPTMKQHLAAPSDLIDVTAIAELHGIAADGKLLKIGAAMTHAEVSESPIVRLAIPVLAGLAGSIGDRHVRHRGTIGGSIANNDPAADYPSAVLALNAMVVTDRRRVAADDFFTGLYQTAREPGEIVTRIEFPIPTQACYAKFRSPASRYSIVGVFVARTDKAVRVAVTGAGASGVFRPAAFEQALAADFRSEAIAHCSVDPALLLSDLNGTAEYRAHLIGVLASRAVAKPGQIQSFK
ncbi:MAG TPA: xanthine dehydrogenase family protein subunit M [Micropepsaceae bacterium]|jgi:carbon-monoxide dehydrogenase medium subunit